MTEADFPGDRAVEADLVERTAAARSKRVVAACSEPEGVWPLELAPAKITEIQVLTRVREQTVPSTVTVAVAGDRLEERLRREAASHGSVSALEVAICEVARLLPEWPELNAFYADGRAWQHQQIAIGFAVNLGRSLRVPVVKDAAHLSLRDIARAVRDLSLRYMRRKPRHRRCDRRHVHDHGSLRRRRRAFHSRAERAAVCDSRAVRDPAATVFAISSLLLIIVFRMACVPGDFSQHCAPGSSRLTASTHHAFQLARHSSSFYVVVFASYWLLRRTSSAERSRCSLPAGFSTAPGAGSSCSCCSAAPCSTTFAVCSSRTLHDRRRKQAGADRKHCRESCCSSRRSSTSASS